MMPEVVSEYYNRLLDVREANAKLQQNGGTARVLELLELIRQHGYIDRVGIRLLHRHCDIGTEEVMLETIDNSDGFSLVTAPVELGSSGTVNSWVYLNGEYRPVEFSDPALLAGTVSPADQLELFGAIATRLRETGLETVLGPSVNYGDAIAENDPQDGSVLLERSEENHRANVLKYTHPRGPEVESTIETKWVGVESADQLGRMVLVAAGQCACSVSPHGGHLGTHVHLPGSAGPIVVDPPLGPLLP